VDHDFAAPTFKLYPDAKIYKDYRQMLDKQKNIDAVVIATPDHTHAVIAMAAIKAASMSMPEAPDHDVYESRRLAQAAKEAKVASRWAFRATPARARRVCE